MCCCQGFGHCGGAMVYLSTLLFVCECWPRVCTFIWARECFMVNKQLFSAKVSRPLIRSPAVTLRQQFLGDESRHISQLCQFGASHSDVLQRAGCLLPLTALAPSENGPTSTPVFEINPDECSLRPLVLWPIRVFCSCS